MREPAVTVASGEGAEGRIVATSNSGLAGCCPHTTTLAIAKSSKDFCIFSSLSESFDRRPQQSYPAALCARRASSQPSERHRKGRAWKRRRVISEPPEAG